MIENPYSDHAVHSAEARVCCLYRVSTTKQVDHDDQNQADIPVQRKACREFAERMGWKIVFEEQETGVSGFKVSAKVVRMIYDLCIGSGFGILKSGATESEIFPELQIISPENFEQAQKLLEERASDCNYQRTMPLTTRGQSLLSGNIFCGHCGARLTLTTNGTVYKNANGERVPRRRIRYVCYNKTRKRGDCTGQTGYTMHILDKMVTDVLHQIFDKMKAADADEIIARTSRNATVTLQERLKAAKAECAKATTEYDSLKAEVVKAVQGRSRFSMDILSELVDNARERMLEASSAVTTLNDELAKETQRMESIVLDYQRVMQWADIFDKSEMPVKKMIAGYIIKRIDVYADYQLHIELNMNIEQFDLGLDTIIESGSQRMTS